MDARWMPILAAAIGVVGGVGGALVGSFAANEGQEAGFRRERAAAEKDLRREAYGTFLGTAQEVWATYLANLSKLERAIQDESNAAAQDDAAAAQDEIDAAAVRLYVAEARVALVAKDADVTDAAIRVREMLTETPVARTRDDLEKEEAAYGEVTADFLAAARED